jgi:hypothetical protein
VWATYVDHWDELTTLWHQGDYGNTTGKMRELRSSAELHRVGVDERSESIA